MAPGLSPEVPETILDRCGILRFTVTGYDQLKGRDLVSIADLTGTQAREIIRRAAASKKGKTAQGLRGKMLALLFEKPSLRTRVSFDVAMDQLGGHSIYLSPQEVGLGKRESAADVARVLSRYVSGIVARTFAHQTVADLARFAAVPVINGLSDYEHPCQALADLLTIYEKKGKLEGVPLTYIGDANNVANSLMLGAAMTGMKFTLCCPQAYGPRPEILKKAQEFATASGGDIRVIADPKSAVSGASVVYTDVWVSMGQEGESKERLAAFAAYQVSEPLLAMADKEVIFMHPLPAHYGEEVEAGLTDSPRSAVYDQAENRLHAQRAILAALLS